MAVSFSPLLRFFKWAELILALGCLKHWLCPHNSPYRNITLEISNTNKNLALYYVSNKAWGRWIGI